MNSYFPFSIHHLLWPETLGSKIHYQADSHPFWRQMFAGNSWAAAVAEEEEEEEE